MKFAGNYSSKVHDFQGANPFKARATREISALEGKQVVTESTLSVIDQVNSSHVDDINNALYAGYDQGDGKTFYLTNTVDNGVNEKGTEILDFEYNFPVDSSSGDNTFRQYAPMSAANAEWDTERLSGEKAKYACLDSGKVAAVGLPKTH